MVASRITLLFLHAVLTLAVIAVGCRHDSRLSKPDDSAIITNAWPATVPAWRVPVDSPTVSLGNSDDPDYDFEVTPVAVWLSDGRIVVADASSWPVKVYTADGRLIKKFQRGEGPEEFNSRVILPLLTAGDTVVFWQYGNAPMRIMAPSLQILPSIGFLPGTGARFQLLDRLTDGTWTGIRHLVESLPDGQRPGVADLRWIGLSADGTAPRSYGRFPEIELGPVGSPMDLFARVTSSFFRGAVGYFAFNERPEIEVRDTAGAVRLRFRVDLPQRRVRPKDVEYFAKNVAAQRGTDVAAQRDIVGRAYVAKWIPYFDKLLVTPEGVIWASLYRRGYFLDDQRFLIFSPEGRLIATTVIPGGWTEVLSVHDDAVLLRAETRDGNGLIMVVPIRK